VLGLLIGFAIALLLTWVVLAVAVLVLRPPGQSIRDLTRVFPDTIRLLRALYRDPGLPRSVRWRLRVALIYNLQPINLIPDFIPVIGVADNVLVIIWAIRGTVRAAGSEAVDRHWQGSPNGLEVVYRAVGLPRPPSSSTIT
jgi:uncharacterized membrane protein YkvA (DUF1232 family)